MRNYKSKKLIIKILSYYNIEKIRKALKFSNSKIIYEYTNKRKLTKFKKSKNKI
jgi:hypothetical protein